jgi:hypothetical protein
MGCIICKNANDETVFICGEKIKPDPCRDCNCEADYLCDYPVGNDKTCDARLCKTHAAEIAPNIHYCNYHYKKFMEFETSGGVKKYLENVIPFPVERRAHFT